MKPTTLSTKFSIELKEMNFRPIANIFVLIHTYQSISCFLKIKKNISIFFQLTKKKFTSKDWFSTMKHVQRKTSTFYKAVHPMPTNISVPHILFID
jgi:hypothetical protein